MVYKQGFIHVQVKSRGWGAALLASLRPRFGFKPQGLIREMQESVGTQTQSIKHPAVYGHGFRSDLFRMGGESKRTESSGILLTRKSAGPPGGSH